MDTIEIATLLPGAIPFSDSNVNQTWKGHVRTDHETVIVFAKIIDPREICVEAFCAILGREVGLPIPKPFLILADSESLNTILPGQSALMFGSEDAEYPSFRRYADCEEALEKLGAFKATLDVGVFDEWIANHDRNIGNILYDGGGDFMFIDHGLSLPQGMPADKPALDNNILRALYSVKSEIEKFRNMRTASQDITPMYRSLNLERIMERTHSSSYIPEHVIMEILSFLSNRLPSIESLIRSRLRISQMDMFNEY
ncbi:HipA family kinase [Pantoea sp. C3]|uniref:HipA family kinase n=1 Tax=Pantoea phytostimulans TaxID=2769024 RepID=UPI0038F6F653